MAGSRKTLREIFFWPALIACVNIVGLIAGLLGNGVWDLVSWSVLSIPVWLSAWFVVRRET